MVMVYRPGYIWNGTEWVSFGPDNIASIPYQASEPTSPQIGDLWVDSDGDTSLIDMSSYSTTSQIASTYSPISTTGLVLLNSTDFTASQYVQVNNCFTATYPHYQIELIISSSSSTSYYYWMQECSGGTPLNTLYNSQRNLIQGSAVASNVITGGSTGELAYVNEAATAGSVITVKVMNPFSSTLKTGYSSNYFINRNSSPWCVQGTCGGARSAAVNSIDGIRIGTGSTVTGTDATMTGTIKIYGYK
jgi:hypothetical protein